MTTQITNSLEDEAKVLLEDIGDRYGTLTHNTDSSYDLTTYGGAHLHYPDAVHGCDDWYSYIMMVIDDTIDAYDLNQIELLRKIHKHLHSNKSLEDC